MSSSSSLDSCHAILAVLGAAESNVHALAVRSLPFTAQVRVRQSFVPQDLPADLLGRAHLADRLDQIRRMDLAPATLSADEDTDEVLAAALATEPAPAPEPERPVLVASDSEAGRLLTEPSGPPGPTTDEVDDLVDLNDATLDDYTGELELDESDVVSFTGGIDPLPPATTKAPAPAPEEEEEEEDDSPDITVTMPEGRPFSLDDANLVSFDDTASGLVVTDDDGLPEYADDLEDIDPADAAAALVQLDDDHLEEVEDIDEEVSLVQPEPEIATLRRQAEQSLVAFTDEADSASEETTARRQVPDSRSFTDTAVTEDPEELARIAAAASAEADGEIDLFGSMPLLDPDEEDDEDPLSDGGNSAVADDLSALQDLIGFDEDIPTLEAADQDDEDHDSDFVSTDGPPLVSLDDDDLQEIEAVELMDEDDLDEISVGEELEDDEALEAFEDAEDLVELGSEPDITEDVEQAARSASVGVRIQTAVPADDLSDVLGGAAVPTIRDSSEARPRAAAAAIQLGPGGTSKVLGLEEEEEPIELAAADFDDDDDYDSVDGFALEVEEEEYEDDEPEAPQLTDDDSARPDEEDTSVHEVAPTVTQAELEAIRVKAQEASQSSLEDAVTYWSDFLDLSSDDPSAHISRGRLYLDLSDYSRAMSDFQRAEVLSPESPEPLVAMGDLFFNRKDYARAIDYFNQALKMAPEHAMAYCRRGISHYYRKNYVDALGDLEKAAVLDDDIPNIGTYVDMAKKKARRRK